MTPRLIVDGNNVMGSRPDGWWRDRPAAARRLVALLERWAQSAGEDVLVVFDGPVTDLAPPARVEVRFAARRGPDAADDVIAELVARDTAPRALRVVTSDAALAARVRAHGATVLGARGFRDALEEG
jgi:predicted RNA-binding protein with PIN domain